MKDQGDSRLPRWPLWTVLSLLVLLEIFFIVMFLGEAGVSGLPTLINSAGILVLCIMVWMRNSWGRWGLLFLLFWRLASIGIKLSEHFGDHRTPGSLILMGFYIVAGVVIASPLGRDELRSSE